VVVFKMFGHRHSLDNCRVVDTSVILEG
jgi:hypothetical protein